MPSPPAALPPEALHTGCRLEHWPATAEVSEGFEAALGQDRAVEAVTLARGMRREGYNLFVMGGHRSVAERFVRGLLEEEAALAAPPSDWVYVNNFDAPMKPVAIAMPAGRAAVLRDAMDALIEDLRASLPAMFDSEDYRRRRETIEEEIQSRQEEAFREIGERAREKGTAILRTPMGFAVAPMRDDQVVPPEKFREWPEEEQTAAQQAIEEVQEELQTLMRQQPRLEKERREAVRRLDRETVEMVVGQSIDEVAAQFSDLPAVLAYLDHARSALIENAPLFRAAGEAAEQDPRGPLLQDGMFQAFSVNAIVAREAGDDTAPVEVEDHPTMMNLVGRVEHVAHQGALVTNFTLIRPGALHRANGGYLLLEVRQLLSEPFAWAALKRALRAGSIRISSPQEYFGLATTVSLEPDPIPLDVKVVLFGERLHYYLMLALDPDLRELFKLVADFEDETDRDAGADRDLAAALAAIGRREGFAALDRGAAEALVDHAGRLAEDSQKLALDIGRLTDRLAEADHRARAAGRERIAREDVAEALAAERRRIGRLRERMQEAILRDLALIDVEGEAVGQVNGLSVSEIGDLRVGRPVRITARVRVGGGEVIDIEREAKLGGPIHSKGVLVLSGYLAGRYALEAPISLRASLVFEQSYGGVDGDSASCAELCALISALSEIPLRQDLAITGSVNQHGRVQAIGGVNDKIEGVFDICAARGLTGSQGVLIPASNVQHLMLRAEVVEACRAGRFAVWPVETVDEAVALLTGREPGARGADGRFPEGTVNAAVEAALERFAELRHSFAARPAGPDVPAEGRS